MLSGWWPYSLIDKILCCHVIKRFNDYVFFHQSMTYHTVERYVRCRPTHLVILSISNIALNSATWRLPLLMPAASPGSLSPTRQLLILCQRKALSCQRLRFRSLVRMWVGRGSKKTLYIDKYIFCISKNIIGWEGVNVVTAEPKKISGISKTCRIKTWSGHMVFQLIPA